MKKLFSSPYLHEVSQLRDILQQEGIECTVANENTSYFGEGTVSEMMPELWLHEDADERRALEIKELWLSRSVAGGEWTCPACGEKVDGNLGACWKCGQPRVVSPNP